MSLTLDLKPEEETALRSYAAAEGVTPDRFIARLLEGYQPTPAHADAEKAGQPEPHDQRDRLAQAQALITKWQAQDSTPTAAPAPNDGTMTPSEALFRQWEHEDEKLTDAEWQAQAELWEQFQHGIDTERAAAGMRSVF